MGIWNQIANTIDLIETLWNVKDNKIVFTRIGAGRFNRDIVECKDQREIDEDPDGDQI